LDSSIFEVKDVGTCPTFEVGHGSLTYGINQVTAVEMKVRKGWV